MSANRLAWARHQGQLGNLPFLDQLHDIANVPKGLRKASSHSRDIRTLLLIRAKLYQQVWKATLCTWLSIFLEWAAVKRENRFICWRMVRRVFVGISR